VVVDEDALRARAREYLDGMASRWPKSRVVFASKAFPCTAVQRVMVDEGLGLDVAGGGEILTALKAGVDPAQVVLHGNAKTDEEIRIAVEHGLGLVVVDNADDVDRLEATLPEVALFGQRFEAGIVGRSPVRRRSGSRSSAGTAREWRRPHRGYGSAVSHRGRPARRTRNRRLLLHDGEQLRRHPPDPRRVRESRRCAARRPP
jgi:Pyridoxal-dependent decarboxylase, pyridoxal binding domain